ncbi:MAG: isoprenylcysteine carboxylmethyltransferase family protein [Anaerolineales bacterium]|nr:isoprenylcysteine carboxylmethyltransferase family protein [Anaerolineales bacterium]MCX7756441.1 isoprenylcysteine carboxylmethyltransferase family protein [Anaerolineales bacterium]MDW8277732.1 isoprenylcysteine carboxylmethyltransferase family protein [Anaerolineales bacterium]
MNQPIIEMGTLYLIVASILWGVVHSLLASHTAKQAARRAFGPAADRLYRFSYNLFSLASFVPILGMLLLFPDQNLYVIPEPWVYLSVLLQGAAFFALVAGVMQTGPFEFAGLTQLAGLDAPKKLVTDGLYAYVRHPLYTAGLVFLWAWPEMTVNRLAVWVVFSLYLVIGAWFEERKLLQEFGEEYAAYRARTPMLIPRLRR